MARGRWPWAVRAGAVAAVLVALVGCAGRLGLREPAPLPPGSRSAPELYPGEVQAAPAPAPQPQAGEDRRERQVRPFISFRAPEVVAVDVATGKEVKLSALVGTPVYLNFWATWCPPCRQEMPAMERLHQRLQGKLQVVAVGVDPAEDKDKLLDFAQVFKLTFAVAHDGGKAAEDYFIRGVPTSIFIDKDGVITARVEGALDDARMAQLADAAMAGYKD